MEIQNICKFTTKLNDNKIYTRNFVYEKSCDTFEQTVNHNRMYLVTGGKGKYTCGEITKEVGTGYLFFSFTDIPYKIESLDKLKYIYISFDGSRSGELFERFSINNLNCVFDGFEGYISLWENSLSKANEKNLDLISEGVLLYTFGEMAPEEKNNEKELIGKIIKFAENNYTDSEMNLNILADNLGYNSKYISRIFKKETGMNFSTYITNVRIKNAIFLIEQGVTSIKNLALLSGYKDPLYFSNVFKNTIGLSPSEYISKNKADTD
ncbi:MAG: helix-turn-helix transcriptional regulator [Ruminococcaceae bacterium]|nr:helix-turn-helix transcriptional regulator [Oscillospiraceae bacterium]